MNKIEKDIAKRLAEYENPKRIALSKKYPILKRPILFLRYSNTSLKNFLNPKIRSERKTDFFESIVARHQSVLRRRLGDSDPRLQESKIINLTQAIKKLNGLVIKPGKIFSLWHAVGKPTYKAGFVDGMLLANGKVVEGLGGGMCQLSNFLHWIFLHAPVQIIERYHHSMDVFPDSGRTLPFGGGATVLYNFVDLKIKNVSKQPLQIKLWLTDAYLKGQILAPHPFPEKYHVFEKNHFFVKRGDTFFRYNEIFRETKIEGKVKKTEKLVTNFAPVLYQVTDEYLKENGYEVLDFTNRKLTPKK